MLRPASNPVPDDLTALRAALAAEQLARREAEARASGAESHAAQLHDELHDRLNPSADRIDLEPDLAHGPALPEIPAQFFRLRPCPTEHVHQAKAAIDGNRRADAERLKAPKSWSFIASCMTTS